MAQTALDRSHEWDSSRAGLGGYGMLADSSYYTSNFASNYDYVTRSENSPAGIPRDESGPLTELETIEVFRNAVDVARELVHKQGENEKIDAAVQPNLTLDLKRKGVESLPEEVIQIIKRDVERIVLSHNHISHLPYRFFECATMQYLNLRGNRFTDFPKPLLKMQKLQILDLSRNKIGTLPEEIRNMKALRVLSVMHNGLSDLPLCLGFLESLRILKMAGNPLNEQLKNIVDGSDSTASPLTIPIAENEKDALLTIKIKQYLKNEINALESGGESSSESPLETPRPLKRNTSIRFPVVPATSGSESVPDLRSPNLAKPPIPNRSHYRMASGQNGTLQNASFRRPSASPLILSNERNRSNSENVLPATHTSRNKRMAIVPRKTSLSPLEESSINRNSLHLRGTSHGSVLKDRNHQVTMNGNGSHPGNAVDNQQYQGTYIRRLSSLPEQKNEHLPSNSMIDGAKGLLFSLYTLHPYISSLLPLTGDDGSKRSSLERVFYNSSTHLDSLDHELHLYDSLRTDSGSQRKRLTRNVRRACRACIIAYQQVGKLLMKNARQLLAKGDARYIRMLLLLVYGSTVEASNALFVLSRNSSKTITPQIAKGPRDTNRDEVPKLTVRAMTPTQERPSTTRRLRSETKNSSRAHQVPAQGHNKSATHPQSAVPLYINGRSRSNSRSNAYNPSATSSLANTPGSGESFLIPGATALAAYDGNGSSNIGDPKSDVVFERVYLSLQNFVDHAQAALPMVCSLFGRCLEAAQAKYENKNLIDLWARLSTRSRQTLDLCETLRVTLSTLTLNDPEIRNSMDFWSQVTRFTNAFVNTCDEIKRATATNREQMTPLDISRILKPVHTCVKSSIQLIRDSPWAYVLTNNASEPQQTQFQWQANGHLNSSIASRLIGHHRTRGDSGSSSSPYMPTTPLSAALGPAAQATIPSSASGSNSFDRSFQGDVFQRAEFALTMSHSSVLHRRN